MTDTTRDAPPKLELRGLRKAYRDRVVLDGIDLSVDEHEVVCLIGPSGSGKSTILRCIDLLDEIDSGDILLDGQSITDDSVSPTAVRRRFGIVFQSFNLFPHLNLVDNLTLGPRKALRMGTAEAEQRAMDLLTRFGLDAFAKNYPDQMSGGQQQRAAIARALIGQPEVLLLDEITSALDPELVGEVLSVIKELAADGITMLLATHEMGFARDVASRVAFLDGGRLVEVGSPAQVLGAPTEPRTREFLRRVIEAGRL